MRSHLNVKELLIDKTKVNEIMQMSVNKVVASDHLNKLRIEL